MERREEKIPSTVKVYAGILLSIIFFVGLFSNSLNILAVALYRKLNQKPLSLLLLNLCVCGLIIDVLGVTSVGLYIIQDWPAWLLPHHLCTASSFATHTCTSCMVLTLLMISLERYFASIKRKLLPLKLILIVVLVFWVLSASIHSSHSFQVLKVQHLNSNVTTCDLIYGDSIHDDIHSTIATIAILCIVFLVLSLIFLAITGNHLRKLRKMKMPASSKTFKVLLQDFKLTFIITCLCFCFWLPTWLLTVLQKHENNMKGKVIILANTISFLNTIFTPIVCIMFSKNFRRCIKDIFMGCKTSSIREPTKRDATDSMTDPLTNRQTVLKQDYEELNTPPKFEKGIFKSCNNETNMESVSIDSRELSPLKTAKDNNSFTSSDEHIHTIDTMM